MIKVNSEPVLPHAKSDTETAFVSFFLHRFRSGNDSGRGWQRRGFKWLIFGGGAHGAPIRDRTPIFPVPLVLFPVCRRGHHRRKAR